MLEQNLALCSIEKIEMLRMLEQKGALWRIEQNYILKMLEQKGALCWIEKFKYWELRDYACGDSSIGEIT